jgi:hypothetical protein
MTLNQNLETKIDFMNDPTYWRDLTEEEAKVFRQLEIKLRILGIFDNNKSIHAVE